MSRRSKDWNEDLAEDLKDIAFARAFIVAAIEEGASLQEALAKVIKAFGLKEFSELSGIASPHVLRALDLQHNPTQKTLEELLKPFGLRLSVTTDKEVA